MHGALDRGQGRRPWRHSPQAEVRALDFLPIVKEKLRRAGHPAVTASFAICNGVPPLAVAWLRLSLVCSGTATIGELSQFRSPLMWTAAARRGISA